MSPPRLLKQNFVDADKLTTYVFGFLCVIGLTEFSSHFSQINQTHGLWPSFIEFVFNVFICTSFLILGIVLAAHIRVANWLKLSVIAVLAPGTTALLDFFVITQWLKLPSWWTLQQARSDLHWMQPLLVFINLSAGTILVLVVYNYREIFLRSQQSLQTLQDKQTETARKLLQAQLQAMQAQVEPTFLLNTLKQVEELYEKDSKQADKLLDDLITYLRSAIPRMRSNTSTLQQEFDLAMAYLRLLAELGGKVQRFKFDLDSADAGAEFPPMVLTPLLSRCAAYCSQFTIAAKRGDSSIILGIAMNIADDFHLSELDKTLGLEEIRERLHALYGELASVAGLITQAGTLSLRIVVPFATVSTVYSYQTEAVQTS